jgi:hypothetical protein
MNHSNCTNVKNLHLVKSKVELLSPCEVDLSKTAAQKAPVRSLSCAKPIIPALKRPRQEDQEFKTSLGNIASSRLVAPTNKRFQLLFKLVPFFE